MLETFKIENEMDWKSKPPVHTGGFDLIRCNKIGIYSKMLGD